MLLHLKASLTELLVKGHDAPVKTSREPHAEDFNTILRKYWAVARLD